MTAHCLPVVSTRHAISPRLATRSLSIAGLAGAAGPSLNHRRPAAQATPPGIRRNMLATGTLPLLERRKACARAMAGGLRQQHAASGSRAGGWKRRQVKSFGCCRPGCHCPGTLLPGSEALLNVRRCQQTRRGRGSPPPTAAVRMARRVVISGETGARPSASAAAAPAWAACVARLRNARVDKAKQRCRPISPASCRPVGQPESLLQSRGPPGAPCNASYLGSAPGHFDVAVSCWSDLHLVSMAQQHSRLHQQLAAG